MRAHSIVLAAVALVAFTRPVAAQNLVQDHGFAGPALTLWPSYASSAPDPAGTGTGVWDGTQDVDGSPTSGSAHVQFGATPTGSNAAFGVSQCIDLTAQQPVTTAIFGTRFKLPTAQVANGSANVTIDVDFFSTTTCTGTLITGGSQGKTVLVPADLSDSVWLSSDIALPGFDITPLASPMSAQMRLVARRVGTNSNTLDVFFDSAYFAVNGTTPIELLGLEVE